MTPNIPNLDAMPSEELMQFWAKHQHGRNRADLGLSGRHSKRITWDLANYASNIATAKSCRLRGDIQTALMYEGIAERIYQSLPQSARW